MATSAVNIQTTTTVYNPLKDAQATALSHDADGNLLPNSVKEEGSASSNKRHRKHHRSRARSKHKHNNSDRDSFKTSSSRSRSRSRHSAHSKMNIVPLHHGRYASHDAVKFKTQICAHWKQGHCSWGDKCHFAHGDEDMKGVSVHNNKTVSEDVLLKEVEMLKAENDYLRLQIQYYKDMAESKQLQ
eukprot:701042_1